MVFTLKSAVLLKHFVVSHVFRLLFNIYFYLYCSGLLDIPCVRFCARFIAFSRLLEIFCFYSLHFVFSLFYCEMRYKHEILKLVYDVSEIFYLGLSDLCSKSFGYEKKLISHCTSFCYDKV